MWPLAPLLMPVDLSMPAAALAAIGGAGGVAILAGAFALGLRHGIDWDHIAAITDITSTTVRTPEPGEEWLTHEPSVMLTDEGHHRLAAASVPVLAGAASGAGLPRGVASGGTARPGGRGLASRPAASVGEFVREHRQPLYLGTLYALGHAMVVTLLGVLALVGSQFLPAWLDPVMGRVVGVTLLLLAAYLFYSLYRYSRGGEFRIRSRWMVVFAGLRHVYRRLLSRIHGHEHPHRHQEEGEQPYGPRTAYAVGLIHGIGAETGTQALVIATAVGATSKATGVAALVMFVLGLLVSNTFVTVASTGGFVSARGRQRLYVVVGFVAAVFSLVVGLAFLAGVDSVLPELDRYFRWIGGPG